MLSEPPLVGRDEELERLYNHIANTLSGKGRLVLISGEAGIGKTRILGKLSETAVKAGFLKIEGECVPGPPLPYMPFFEAFKSFNASPFTYNNVMDSTRPSDSTSILFGALNLMIRESRKQPLLVCLEDIHWADSATIQLIHFLARNIRDSLILMVGTYRPEDLIPSLEGEVHPLQSSIRQMIREGILTEVSIERIGQEDLSVAIEGMLGSQIDPEIVTIIYEHSNGNPLFAVETIRLLVTTGDIALKEGKYTVTRSMPLAIPGTVMEVISRRVERTSNDERRALEFASVIGLTFSPDLLADALKMDHLELQDRLERLSYHHQLIREVDNGYAFTHEKVCRITYDSISKIRRREMHRGVGLTIERRSPPYSNVYGTLSMHFIGANDNLRSVLYSVLAAQSSKSRNAIPEVVHYFRQALEIINEKNETVHFKLTALKGLADAEGENEVLELKHSVDLYEECLRLGVKDSIKGQVLSGLAISHHSNGNGVRAWELIEEAKKLPWYNEVELAIFKDYESSMLAQDGDYEAAEVLCKEAEIIFEKNGIWSRLVRILMVHIVVALGLGKTEEAIVMGRKGEELVLKHGIVLAHENQLLGIAFTQKGDYELALDYLTRDIEQDEKMGDKDYMSVAYQWQSDVWHAIGEYENARRCAMKARDLAYSVNSVDMTVEAFCSMIHYLLMEGKVNEAKELFSGLTETLNNHVWKTPILPNTKGRIELIKAEMALHSGSKIEADQRFSSALDIKGYFLIYNLADRNRWYGEVLLKTGHIEDGKARLRDAIKHYSRLSNDYQVKRLTAIIENYSK